MQKPPIATNEESRLAVLRAYKVLDTLPEEAYDNITKLASLICGTPIALVSLVDENRQWFKSRVGLDVTETGRDTSFCGHAILQTNSVFEIPDAQIDPRFSDNPLVTGDPRVIFYAGAPLKTPGGEQIGTLCVIDHQPRKLTAQQTEALTTLAAQVVLLLELRSGMKSAVDSLSHQQTLEELRLSSRKLVEESERTLVETLESMNDAFFALDANWNLIICNEKFQQITHLAKDELIGKNFVDLFFATAEHRDTVSFRELQRAMNERVSVRYDDYYKPLNIWTENRVSPKSDGGIVVFFNDVTEAREAGILLKKSENDFRAITEATPLIVWTAQPDGMVDYANSRWYEFSGLTEEETFGAAFLNSVHPDDVEQTKMKYAEALTTLKPLEIEHRFRRKADGAYRWFLTRALPSVDENGQATKWFGTNVDIDDQKRDAAELVVAKSDAERANHAKSAFLANMSHEIRTPLGAIIGFTDLLKGRDLNSEERSQYLETIARSGKALTRIIDDILDLAKVESGKLDIEHVEFSIHELIDDVMDLFRERAKSKGIFLRSVTSDSVPARLVSDPTRLRQILINLIGNAVKFTDKGGVAVSITAQSLDQSGTQLTLSIKDSGIGLSEEQQSKLFQPFMQADNSTTRQFGGTGLGLALSKRLANALGGDILITEYAPETGCTFTLTVPTLLAATTVAVKPEPVASEQRNKVRNESAIKGMKVLVADDSSDNQTLLKIILRKLEVHAEFASNGLEAFQKAMSGNFDVVLMDIQMPIMDGYEATKKLRDSGYTKPIIALTAHAMAEERARTKAAGCTSHLTKPIDRAELIFTLEEYASESAEDDSDRRDH